MGTQRMCPGQDAFTDGADGGGGGGGAQITSSALVIVQLSHLDRYAAVRGERVAQALASRLIHAIHAIHEAQGVQHLHARERKPGFQEQHGAGAPMGGPIILADAQWPLGPASGARLRVLTVLSATPQVVWVHQDLTHERWPDARQRLVAEVQRLQIRAATIGGCWATRSEMPSWVSTTAVALYRAGIQTKVVSRLCAYVDDLAPASTRPPTPRWSGPLIATGAAEREAEREAEAAFLRFLLLF